jgi:anthranilate phosphoribosyltransferase
MLRDTLTLVMAGQSLHEEQADETMHEMMTGQIPPAQIAAILTALRMKGETVDEIAGLARGMRANALVVDLPDDVEAMDTCGTGGDHAGTFNISTAAAFVVASAGQPVAKHGNRAATSQCGSADVLEALGARIDLAPDAVARCIRETGFGFMFALTYHPAMKFVAPVRREIGFRTVFNILGPLTNPARVKKQVLGVADVALVRPMAEVLLRLGVRRALVVHGEDGIDEFSLSTFTRVAEVDGDAETIREYRVHPTDVGLTSAPREAIAGGDAKRNAHLLRGILAGEVTGAPADVVCLNAGAALYAAGRAPTIAEGVTLARAQLRPERALRTLGAFIALSQDLAAVAERDAVRASLVK